MGIAFQERKSGQTFDICQNLGSTLYKLNFSLQIPTYEFPRGTDNIMQQFPQQTKYYLGQKITVVTCDLQDTIDLLLLRHPLQTHLSVALRRDKTKPEGEQIKIHSLYNNMEGILFDANIPRRTL